MYLTLAQASEKLERTERQVRYLVKTAEITPVNADTYRRDGGYRFKEEEVEALKKKLNIEGISLQRAAKIVGVSPQYLNSLALKESIPSQLITIGNRKERRFQEKDCIELIDSLNNRTHSKLAQYGNKLALYSNQFRLFQLKQLGNEIVRVVNTKPLTLLKADGTTIKPNISEMKLLNTDFNWDEKRYITKKGFITFEVPMPRYAEHSTYDMLYRLIDELGEKNIQVFERSEGDYFIRCRQGKLSLSSGEYFALKRFIIEGNIEKVSEGTYSLQSAFISQYIHLPYPLYKKILHNADTSDTSFQDEIINVIKRGLSDT